MAEHKNTFTKSRMNKDLDARLLPRGEYRDATNISVSKSEDEGVGSLENIKGNELLKKATLEAEETFKRFADLKVIGDYVDVSNDKVFLFLTRYSDGSESGLDNFSLSTPVTYQSNKASTLHWIVCVEIKETGTTLNKLCTGSFLNFSQTHPVLGINLIEDLLFWTDNRNQPRKLNVKKALQDSSYYDSEDKISLAKYYPYEPISLLQTKNGFEDTSMKNVTQKWLPSTNSPTIAFPSTTGSINPIVVDGVDCHAFQVYTYYDYFEITQWYLSGLPKEARTGNWGDAATAPSVPSSNPEYFPGDKWNGNKAEGGAWFTGTNFTDGVNRSYLPAPLGFNSGTNTITQSNQFGTYGSQPYNRFGSNNGAIFGGSASKFPGDGSWCQFKWDDRSIARKQLVTCNDNVNGASLNFDNDCRLLQAIPVKFGWTWSNGSNGTFGQANWNSIDEDASTIPSYIQGEFGGVPGSGGNNNNNLWLWSFSIYAPAKSNGDINSNLQTLHTICQGEQGAFVGSTTSNPYQSNNSRNNPNSIKPKLFFHYPNPNYIDNFESSPVKIDESYLKQKFVRFSYRFKFEDDEYSLIAPFTQIAFIPEQYGHFLDTDEAKARKSLDVSFMQNYVNQIVLKIPLPCKQNELKSKFLIDEIEILYKESDQVAIKFIDKLETVNLQTNDESVDFIYNSQEPSKVLPESENVRVFDKTPVRALTQESVGNRVLFGNFIDKPKAPKELQYQLSVSSKSYSSGGTGIEYPMHNIKQNRTYQVGVVLSDRYGRQSDVLTTVFDRIISDENPAPGSTIYVPYRDESTVGNTIQYFGSAINFNLINYIPSSIAGDKDYPGLYSETNPLGWYSYKIVVKQQEQEYYNVYVPGAQSRIMYKKGWSKFDINPLSYCYQAQMGPHSGQTGNDVRLALPNYNSGYKVQGYLFSEKFGGEGLSQGTTTFTYAWSGRLAKATTTADMDALKSYWGYPFYNSITGAMATVRPLDKVEFLYKPDNPKYQIELSGDNINKVPRSLINVGPNDREFAGSDVGLFCRVSPKQWNRNFQHFQKGDFPKSDKVEQIREFNTYNIDPDDTIEITVPGLRVYPGYSGSQTPASGTYNDNAWYGYFISKNFKATSRVWADDSNNPLVGLVDTDNGEVFHVSNVASYDFYNAGNDLKKENSLLIASVSANSNDGKYIVGPEMSYKGKNSRWTRLGVFETTPTKSKLEVFWETSTTGLISELNQALEDAGGPDVVNNFWANAEHTLPSQIPDPITSEQLWITSIGNRYIDGWEKQQGDNTSLQSNAYDNNQAVVGSWLWPASNNNNIQVVGEFVKEDPWTNACMFDLYTPSTTTGSRGNKGNMQVNSFQYFPEFGGGGLNTNADYYVACTPAVGNVQKAYAGEVVSLAATRVNGVDEPNLIKLNPDVIDSDGVQNYNFEVANLNNGLWPFTGGDQVQMDFNVAPIVTSTFTKSITVKNVAPFLGEIWSLTPANGAFAGGMNWLSKVNSNVDGDDYEIEEPFTTWTNRYTGDTDEEDADGDTVVWASKFENGKVAITNNTVDTPVRQVSAYDSIKTCKDFPWQSGAQGTTSVYPIEWDNGTQITNNNDKADIWFCNGNYSDKQDQCTISIEKVYFLGMPSTGSGIQGSPPVGAQFGNSANWSPGDTGWRDGVTFTSWEWYDITNLPFSGNTVVPEGKDMFQIKRTSNGGFYIATKNLSSWPSEIPNTALRWDYVQGGIGSWQLDQPIKARRNVSQPYSQPDGGVAPQNQQDVNLVDGEYSFGGFGMYSFQDSTTYASIPFGPTYASQQPASNTKFINNAGIQQYNPNSSPVTPWKFNTSSIPYNYKILFRITDSNGAESPKYEIHVSVGEGR